MATWARAAKAETTEPIDPGYVTERFPANQGELQIRYVTKKMPLQSLTGDPVGGQLSAALPRPTTSRTGRSSLRSSARRLRPPFTRSVTSIWLPATMNSVTPTTRLSQQWRKLPLFAKPGRRCNPQWNRCGAPFLNGMKRLLREPLLHFLLIGAVLFGVYHHLQPAHEPAASSKRDPTFARRHRSTGAALPVTMEA